MISNSGHDENGGYSGGKAGDQGGEWTLRSWYNRPWDCVIKHPNQKVNVLISDLAKEAANNDMIGYDQSERYSFWYKLVDANYRPKNIKTACESDCSAGVCSIIRAAGYLLGINALKRIEITSTHYMRLMLKNVGFEVLTDKKYLTSDAYLGQGWILLNEQHHTAINVTDGSKFKSTSSNTATTSAVKVTTEKAEKSVAPAYCQDKRYAGTYKVDVSDDGLNLRYIPGQLTDDNVVAVIPPGKGVICYGGYYNVVNGQVWLYVAYGSKIGYVCYDYLVKL